MTVICLTNCPQKLRGDLTKWLVEINTGVYVGNVTARVREALWDRITENIRSGQATMVYRAAGEQHMDFRVHNTTWKPVDFDGLKLIMRPNPEKTPVEGGALPAEGFSKAARMRKARQRQRFAQNPEGGAAYTVVDVETTGLNYNRDAIIELGALRVRDGRPVESFSCLVQAEQEIPPEVQALTGLANADLEGAMALKPALEQLLTFLGSDCLLCWNAAFDLAFLQIACKRCGLPIPKNKTEDAYQLARKTLCSLPDYHLSTAAEHFGIDANAAHRALQDCYLTHAVYLKLKETPSDI